ncbi:hypothetical protein ACIRPT_16030 [Streptomyces sp. NPDC101227]|uniref:hypothetical protein n=1 Tax=Streptomyces sp. NPDC101227 TaxID=3366136 RepID=UPI0038054E9C
MLRAIGTIFEWTLRRLLPSRGRHRSAYAPPAAQCVDEPMPAPLLVPARHAALLRGEDSYLIRPYVLTSEERRERRAQRGRRRVLWLAACGYDAGPRWIHGVEVGA